MDNSQKQNRKNTNASYISRCIPPKNFLFSVFSLLTINITLRFTGHY